MLKIYFGFLKVYFLNFKPYRPSSPRRYSIAVLPIPLTSLIWFSVLRESSFKVSTPADLKDEITVFLWLYSELKTSSRGMLAPPLILVSPSFRKPRIFSRLLVIFESSLRIAFLFNLSPLVILYTY